MGGSYPHVHGRQRRGSNATQNFTLTITQAPAITSANNTTFTVGTAGSFTVTATGNPAPNLSETGTLPAGVTFNTSTGVLSGTPAAGTGGTYPITFTAANGVDANATQSFTLTINQVPAAITSANNTTFTVGTAGSFNVTATGNPAPNLSETGTLPSGVPNTSTGMLSGTPAAGTDGTYSITFTAANGVGSNATQSFTLTVNAASAAPSITSANSTTFTVGTAGSFTVTATGFPAPSLSETGMLPSGVTFNTSTGVLSGTPAAGTGGSYAITVTAANSVGSNATQSFTLTVNQASVATQFVVTGADAGGGPNITVRDAATNAVIFNFNAYDPNFTGGVRVAAGDVNSDGIPDIITGAGPGGGSDVKIFDGRTGELMREFSPYDPLFTGGQFLAAADVNGDGFDDLIVGADAGGGPDVIIFSGRVLSSSTGLTAESHNFFAYNWPSPAGAAAGDVSGDGQVDLICGGGPGGGPNITTYSPRCAGTEPASNSFAYDPATTGHLYCSRGPQPRRQGGDHHRLWSGQRSQRRRLLTIYLSGREWADPAAAVNFAYAPVHGRQRVGTVRLGDNTIRLLTARSRRRAGDTRV